VAVHHGECECGLSNVIHGVAQVRGMTGGCFTTLLRSDATNDEPSNPVLDKPNIKTAPNQSTMAALLKCHVRGEVQFRERLHIA